MQFAKIRVDVYQISCAEAKQHVRPENGLGFHPFKIKDYPEQGHFFKAAFVPNTGALPAVFAINWRSLLASCPSFSFQCTSRDRVSRLLSQIQCRVKVIREPSYYVTQPTKSTAVIECFIVFHPNLLNDPISQIALILQKAGIADLDWKEIITIPTPLLRKHVSAHTSRWF
jgi:hypothetical protein